MTPSLSSESSLFVGRMPSGAFVCFVVPKVFVNIYARNRKQSENFQRK